MQLSEATLGSLYQSLQPTGPRQTLWKAVAGRVVPALTLRRIRGRISLSGKVVGVTSKRPARA